MIDIKPGVNILGTEYSVKIKKYDEEEIFEKKHISGYCDYWIKEIVICDLSTYPDFVCEPLQSIESMQRETLRHEIVHAFLYESGLEESAHIYNEAWTMNEEMVDWIALQGVKIYRAWEEVGAV